MKQILLIVAAVFINLSVFGQISEQGTPVGWKENHTKAILPTVNMPNVDVNALIAEDEADKAYKDIPWRFGYPIEVNYTLENSGKWDVLPNGDRLWRLRIKSTDALSINLIYNKFWLPEGAKFFVYSENHKQVLGAFTNKNNKDNGVFATGLIAGDVCIIEYYEPQAVAGSGTIEVSKVIHGYKQISNFWQEKNFGNSGQCNVNVNCTLGDDWANQIRSVAMILTANNSRICTGALINNTNEDGKPYFLTANHCLGGESSWIFMFNYQSPTCTNEDGPTDQTIQNCTLLAKNADSDFALLELSEEPPANYNVYFSGWSREDIPANYSVCIHHPSGDVKKISKDNEATVSDYYLSDSGNAPADSHWKVTDWDEGTTEGGSSGSPLFDQNHRIVGQLHGGYAACGNDDADYYGKLSMSWDRGTSETDRLKDWLDPAYTNVTYLDGKDFNTPQYTLDAELVSIEQPESDVCAYNVVPVIKLKNNGATIITEAVINYQLDGGQTLSKTWSGSLDYFSFESISLDQLDLSTGSHTLSVTLQSINGSTDENTTNDEANITFTVEYGNGVHFKLVTDEYSNDENKWYLYDSTGAVISQNTNLNSSVTYNQLFCLENGCYTFIITDTYGDGLSGSYGSPAGSYSFTDNAGNDLGSNQGNFGSADTVEFCVEAHLTIDNYNNKNNDLVVFPNPAQNELFVNLTETHANATVNIYSETGKLVYQNALSSTGNKISLQNIAVGIYFVTINTNNYVYTKRLIINK